jgi:ATP-dependent Lhr-like helicase
VGLSATVDDPEEIAHLLARNPNPCAILHADPGEAPDLSMLDAGRPPPWAGGAALHAIPAVLEEVKRHRTTLIFHNTRAQAEIFFHELWLRNDEGLPIAIHHGSLSREQRQNVEAAMLRGELKAIVCTGTLDLGIDWGDVDLVIQMGGPEIRQAPRPAHRPRQPPRRGPLQGDPGPRQPLRGPRMRRRHRGRARRRPRRHPPRPRPPGRPLPAHPHPRLRRPLLADDLYEEVRTVGGYTALPREDFDACLEFCATGGYSLRAYDRWQRLLLRDGLWQLRDPRAAKRLRMNIGTIEDTDRLKVRLRSGRTLARSRNTSPPPSPPATPS